eukprot:1161567-Pelagomonas_calceolata.AAC.8
MAATVRGQAHCLRSARHAAFGLQCISLLWERGCPASSNVLLQFCFALYVSVLMMHAMLRPQERRRPLSYHAFWPHVSCLCGEHGIYIMGASSTCNATHDVNSAKGQD